MRNIIPLALVLSVAATTVYARQPAEIVQLGSKYYGRDAGAQHYTYKSASAGNNSGDTGSQVISASDSAGSTESSGGAYYYDNSTHQAVTVDSISVKDTTASVEAGSVQPAVSENAPANRTRESASENYSGKIANTGGQKLRWQSRATELERNYREQDRLSALSPAAGGKQETAPEMVKVEENPLKAALEDEISQDSYGAEKPATKKVEVKKEEITTADVEEAEAKSLMQEKPKESTRLSRFVWPARGKVISRFGAEASGVKNDGICIALPEGTSVQAASGGTVIYVGDELEGFGNLVIVRHAENWVTAYGHNQKAMVKRGDKVAQGQVIAFSGNTGSVSTPQLYFSIRKGKQPMDPLSLLGENSSLGKGKLDLALGGERL